MTIPQDVQDKIQSEARSGYYLSSLEAAACRGAYCEGGEFAYSLSQQTIKELQEEIKRLTEILKKEFYYGLRAWGYDFQKDKLWQQFAKQNNL